jgi:chemotaxis protein methyltransferase WspC
MTLLEANIPADRFRLDAADISRKALTAAREAVYRRGSFRERLNNSQDAFFRVTSQGWQLAEAVTGTVRFCRDNLVTPRFLAGEAPYHIIFCRNIFIYLNPEGRRQLLANLDRLLVPEGLLFTGHSEVGYLQQQGFAAIRHPLAFACRKAGKSAAAVPPLPKPEPRPQMPASPPAFTLARSSPAVADIPAQPLPEPEPRPSAVSSLHAEALALADRGEFDAAAELCRRHLSQGRPHADVYCLLGLIHEAARRPGEAEKCYRKALYLDPDHYETLIQASLLYGHQGNSRKALLYRRRAEAQERGADGTDRA